MPLERCHVQTLLFIGGADHGRERVIIGCMSAVFILIVMAIGIFIIVRFVSFEEVLGAALRVFLVVVAGLVAFCLLQQLLVIAILPALGILKSVFTWLVVACAAVLGLLLLIRIAIGPFQKSRRTSGNRKERES